MSDRTVSTEIKTLDQLVDRLRYQLEQLETRPNAYKWLPVYVSLRMRRAAYFSDCLHVVHRGRHVPIVFKDQLGGVWEVDVQRESH